MATLNIVRVLARPETLEPNTLYLIKNTTGTGGIIFTGPNAEEFGEVLGLADDEILSVVQSGEMGTLVTTNTDQALSTDTLLTILGKHEARLNALSDAVFV